MKLLLFIAVALALPACGKPCAFVCASDGDCPQSWYCLDRVACLPTCITCGGACVSTLHDNCGACGHACAPNEVCRNGATCETACASGQMACAGACSDLNKDPFNCGTCGHACARGQVCASATCVNVNTCS